MTDELTTSDEIKAESTLNAEWVQPEEIEPNDWNPNYLPTRREETLINSILKNGWTQPIIVRKSNDTIIDGEQRWRVAQRTPKISDNGELTPVGVENGSIPIYRVTQSEIQSRIATYQHNEATGEHDHELVGELLEDMQDMGRIEEAGKEIGYKSGEIETLLPHSQSESGDETVGEELIDKPWGDEPSPDETSTNDDGETESVTVETENIDMEQISFLLAPEEKEALNELVEDGRIARAVYFICVIAQENDL